LDLVGLQTVHCPSAILSSACLHKAFVFRFLMCYLILFSVQSSVANSMFIMHDGFGIMISLGMMNIPVFDSILQRYLLNHPRELCYYELAASVIMFGEYVVITAHCIR